MLSDTTDIKNISKNKVLKKYQSFYRRFCFYVFSYVKICFAQKRRIKNRIILRKISRRGDETQSENSERSNFSEFCERTSLHGWQHIHRVNTRKGRIVWLSIVLASLSVALLFLTTATKDFANRAVVTTIETTTASLQVSSKKKGDQGFMGWNDFSFEPAIWIFYEMFSQFLHPIVQLREY